MHYLGINHGAGCGLSNSDNYQRGFGFMAPMFGRDGKVVLCDVDGEVR